MKVQVLNSDTSRNLPFIGINNENSVAIFLEDGSRLQLQYNGDKCIQHRIKGMALDDNSYHPIKGSLILSND